jgi:hypothetical protein
MGVGVLAPRRGLRDVESGILNAECRAVAALNPNGTELNQVE